MISRSAALEAIAPVILILFLMPGQAPAQQDDPEVRGRFVQGILAASKDVERLAFRAKCTLSYKNLSLSEATQALYVKSKRDPYQLRSDEVEYAVCGPLSMHRTKDRNGLDVIKVRNGSYAFAISRRSKDERPTLQFLEQSGVNSKIDSRIAEVEQEVRGILLEPYYFQGFPLARLVQSRDFKLKRVYPTQIDGIDAVRAEFDYEHQVDDPRGIGRFTLTDGYLVCDPARKWALVELGATRHTPINKMVADILLKFDYGEPVDGVPIAKRVETTSTMKSDPGTTTQSIHSIEVIDRDVSAEEFLLAHYGLPEPIFSSGGIARWTWYLLAGIACIGFGAYMIRRRNLGSA